MIKRNFNGKVNHIARFVGKTLRSLAEFDCPYFFTFFLKFEFEMLTLFKRSNGAQIHIKHTENSLRISCAVRLERLERICKVNC